MNDAVAPAVWPMDPTELGVEASRWRRQLPYAFCIELGRRMLLAQFEYSEWMLRRVDRVNLERDRSVTRAGTFEFTIRPDAPVFEAVDGRRLLLVPLSIMRRQTLINFHLRDESNQPVTMPGMRLVQQFDQSILLAAAASFHPAAAQDPNVQEFIRSAVAGKLDQVNDAFGRFDADPGFRPLDFPKGLPDHPAFRASVNRLRHNFTLYVFLDAAGPRHRVIRMSFDEPTAWVYQKPDLRASEQLNRWEYRPGRPQRPSMAGVLAALGYTATRFRFQVPGAESAAGYHFEITAPPGVQIVRATLLAGRPNDPKRHVSLDRIVGHSPTVGLHAVEVPNGSLCRVQVDLRAPVRGWLTAILVASFAVMAVVASVAYHWRNGNPHWSPEQITNVVLILVTTSAAVATLVAQRDSGDVGARFVSGVRTFGAASMGIPVAASTALVYTGMLQHNTAAEFDRWFLIGLAGLSVFLFAAIFGTWLCSFRAGRRAVIEESPWDMTHHPKDEQKPKRRKRIKRAAVDLDKARDDYGEAVKLYKFDSQAIGVRSAEGWHDFYEWTDSLQGETIDALRHPWRRRRKGPERCREFNTECIVHHECRLMRVDNERPWADLLEPEAAVIARANGPE